MEPLIHLLIVVVVIALFAYLCHWVIVNYVPAPAQVPALVITGLIFLIVLLSVFLRWSGGTGLKF